MTRDGMMGALAALDAYGYTPADWPEPRDTFAERFPASNWTYTPPPDANEAAAARLARPYARANAARMGENPLPEIAEGFAPQEPWQWGLMFAGPGAGWGGRAISAAMTPAQRMLAAAGLFSLQPGSAEGAGIKTIKGALRPQPSSIIHPTVDNWTLARQADVLKDPQRVLHSGIYKDPRQIAAEAAAQVAPEHPAMKYLFGVTRDDLWEIGGRGTRKGNEAPNIWMPERERGSYAAQNIMTPANAQRQIDALAEAEKYPQLTRGMDAWYVMDPAFDQMVKLVGFDQAVRDYKRFNAIMTPFSSNSTVMAEINRGTAARMMADRGQFADFVKYGGMPVEDRGSRFPKAMRDVSPHLRHNQQLPPVQRYLETGDHAFHKDTVKNPLYSQASGVPATGFQTSLPIPDAHIARSSGMSDVRKNANPGENMAGAEFRQWGPWYRDNVAAPLGIEAVPAQARQWGVFAPQTGVRTSVGAPKLELLAQSIWERAHKLGIDPKKLRDDVLTGKAHAQWLLPVGGLAMGGLAAQDDYQ